MCVYERERENKTYNIYLPTYNHTYTNTNLYSPQIQIYTHPHSLTYGGVRIQYGPYTYKSTHFPYLEQCPRKEYH